MTNATAAPERRRFPAPTPNDTLVSPVVEGRSITFRLYAPEAHTVALRGDLVEGEPRGGFQRDQQGIWTLTLQDVTPGTYRYQYVVDQAIVPDPRNPMISPTHTTVMNLVRVTAPETLSEDTTDVPHGSIASVWYPSPVFGGHRRMQVYTPPKTLRTSGELPVLYLLHGGGDCDASWSTVGRAGFILDNLIATGSAVPMLIVMPSGHAPGLRTGPAGSPAMTANPANDPFTADLLQGVMPWVEANLGAAACPERRALAGLSMGGVQAGNIGIVHSHLFRYLGIFSSGWFPEVRAEFESTQGEAMRAAAERYHLVWVAWGSTDIARPNSLAMLEMFDRHGIRYTARETGGGHTWANWRDYLRDMAPLLFR
ncbi:MAG: alpha/beta hydrolase [Anaerolineae bacterium]|jgi:enterochelin esterase-like enzyme|nr:esterase [Chloroflexota bacterium]